MVKNDRDVLRTIEQAGSITTAPSAERRPERTGEVTKSKRPPRHGAGSA